MDGKPQAPVGNPGLLPPLPRTSPSHLPERMEEPGCDPGHLSHALEALARAGRYLGGEMAIQGPVVSGLPRPPRSVRLLDVGTGRGDLSISLFRHLRAGGWRPSFVLADLHPRIPRLAEERVRSALPPRHWRRFRAVRLDGARLPFPPESFDFAFSATTLHHLERGEAGRFLSEMERVAPGRWAVADLRRSRASLLLIRVLAATLWRRVDFVRDDAPVSVRRAFTPDEVRDLLSEAGVAHARVEGAGPCRLRAVGGAGGGTASRAS